MVSVKEVIVVEGRYDKNTLSQIVDATIVTTDGFAVFKSPEKQEMLRRLAVQRGLIIFTDPDGAGMVIRGFLRGIVDANLIKNAYVPDVFGKERRKNAPSKEGKLGVEGMTPEIILNALKAAGATLNDTETAVYGAGISKADLYALGLCGRENSAEKRKMLQQAYALPARMSANALLQVLNVLTTKEELALLLSAVQQDGDTNDAEQ